MYAAFFGLSEPGFALTPDPRYLFLSAQHREALAHLLYGAGESGGFVLLTGEVGTGKTTVCRAFLEQLPEAVAVALVLNPALTPTELVATICDEFGLERDESASLKTLVDRLNRHLLACHAQGRRPVVMIDEAQNLTLPALEQIRLLTNLETDQCKLLQIFLIGQPELRDRVAELRQLDQRITARFHLRPLRRTETVAYIRHRLAVAGASRPLFTRAALRRVHRLAGGIPRRINLICDRALLGAAVSERPRVTAAIVARAAREVLGAPPPPSWHSGRVAVLAGAVAGAMALGLWLGDAGVLRQARDYAAARWATLPSAGTTPGVETPSGTGLRPLPRLSATAPSAFPLASNAEALLLELAPALSAVLRRWGHEPSAVPSCDNLSVSGLGCEREMGRWSDLRRFDRPAVLILARADGSQAYAALIGLDEEYAALAHPDGPRRLPLATLDERWSGDYLLLWQLPPGGERIIGRKASAEAVRWLRTRLAQLPDSGVRLPGADFYDDELIEAVRRFQAAHGLKPDGIAGPRTLMLLTDRLGTGG